MSSRHPYRRVMVALLAASVLGALAATPAAAEPSGDPGDEGSSANPTLASVLEQTTQAYTDAKARFDASVKRQGELTAQLKNTEAQLAGMQDQVAAIAIAAYRTGPLTTFAALMDAGSPDGFAERAGSINEIAHHNDNLLHEYKKLREDQTAQKKALDDEVATQQQQVATMEKQKKDAETALALAGGPSKGFVSANLPVADPVPRNPDGTLPKESCKVDDPTTTGCLTPRTLHAYKQMSQFPMPFGVGCLRVGDPGEHGKGRACDFMMSGGGRMPDAVAKERGDALAQWCIQHASEYGIMYIIWQQRYYDMRTGTGWRPMADRGSTTANHYDHVHVSVY